jgi:serine/threonine protein phosphatase 1
VLHAMNALFGTRREPQVLAARERLRAPARPAIIYAIGDVHGCLVELRRLEQLIALDALHTAGEKWLVLLGDYIDRGPQSAQVIDHLLAPPADGFRRFSLAGNHEQMLLDFLAAPNEAAEWLEYGGVETLASYGIDARDAGGRPAALAKSLEAQMPRSHLEWLRRLPVSLETPGFFFAHAGVRPGRALAEQEDRDLLWIREPFLESAVDAGTVVVHGHTPVAEPERRAWRIGIDTGAFATGRLTSARIDANGAVRFLSTLPATPASAAPGSY